MEQGQRITEVNVNVKVKYGFPATGLDRPLGFQEVEAPEFLDNRHMKVVRLSALRTGRDNRSTGRKLRLR
jgi:hypothetical protein